MSNDTSMRRFVSSIQAATKSGSKMLPKKIADANKKLTAKSGQKLRLVSDYSKASDETPALRVTCPTKTDVLAVIDSKIHPESVEFYLTRPREDGAVETRQIGTAKYPDSDGTWRITFRTERFARTPTDPVVIHSEVLDARRNVLAAIALAAVS